jgi:hypothetical protein
MQELWCSNTSDSRMRHRCHVTLNLLASGMRHREVESNKNSSSKGREDSFFINEEVE